MISPNTPPALADALRNMEAIVDSRVQSLMYAAPEQVDFHKGEFKQELADAMTQLYDTLTDPVV